ncbi:MAG TPA: DUF3822 family protein [Chitinophagaceae bacterium]|nr:DUF3822 family protein [Chitinophagaceae bacterium]
MNPAYHIKTGEDIHPSEAVLLITAGDFFFSYALMKHLSKEIVEFGYYTFSNDQDDKWTEFFKNNEVLDRRYLHTAIAYNPAASMLVPANYFKKDEIQSQLDCLFGQNFQTVTITEQIPEWNLYNITRISASLHHAINQHFVSGKSLTTNYVLLKNISGEKQSYILIDFRTDEFTVLIFVSNQIQLLKAFSYSSPEDVLFYLLKVCQQNGLSQREVKVMMAGLVEKDSAIFRELYKYFIHLEFEELPSGISLAEELNVCPRHYFSTISKLATCVL